MNKKRRNHYVWKHYLRPWSVRHKIWCLIKNEMIEKRLDDIAVEKDFYGFLYLTVVISTLER